MLGFLSGWKPETMFGLDFSRSGQSPFCGFDPGNWIWSALSWLTLFLLDLGLIRAGVFSGRESWVNLGVGMIALNVVTRYFDLFGNMMDGAALFMGSGALILGGGIYVERQRRRLLARLRQEAA